MVKIKEITCNSPIEAEGFRAVLREAGIENDLYDESNSKVARGILDQRTDVLVKEEDYEEAAKLYQSYLSEQQNVTPWCPKCGSENVILKKGKCVTTRRLPRFLAALLTFIPIGSCTAKKYVCNNCGHKWEC